VFPLIFKFFAAATPAGVEMMTDITSYLDFVMTLFFAFGVAFEIPVAVVLLVWIGVVDVKYLKKIRPYVIIGCFVVGMILTPPDIFSQTLLAVPMWLLFEIGILFGSLIRKREHPDESRRRSQRPAASDPTVNLLLLEEADFIAADRVVLRDRRLTHMQEVHRGGGRQPARRAHQRADGQGRTAAPGGREAELRVSLDQPPPAKLPLTLVLALPRPKMLRRVFQTVATMGVPKVMLVNSYRVEKSFWQTPFLEPEAIREQPDPRPGTGPRHRAAGVIIEKRFKPFVEDRLPAIAEGTLGLVGHPGNYPPCPRALSEPVTLAIGPEGGWIPYEIDLLARPACNRCNWASASCASKPPSPPCWPPLLNLSCRLICPRVATAGRPYRLPSPADTAISPIVVRGVVSMYRWLAEKLGNVSVKRKLGIGGLVLLLTLLITFTGWTGMSA
jgi:16S rRNA U1498 N3-methylase RsmE